MHQKPSRGYIDDALKQKKRVGWMRERERERDKNFYSYREERERYLFLSVFCVTWDRVKRKK